MSLTEPAFSAEQVAAMNAAVSAEDDHAVQLAADRARWNALEAAGFRPLEATASLEGPATVIRDVRFLVESRAPRAWRAAGWRTEIPSWLGYVTYEGVSIAVRVRTVSTKPGSEEVELDKTAEHEDGMLEPALLRALDERLEGWAARELLEAITTRELEPPAIVVMQWSAEHRTTVTLGTDDPVRAKLAPVELRLPEADAEAAPAEEEALVCLAEAA